MLKDLDLLFLLDALRKSKDNLKLNVHIEMEDYIILGNFATKRKHIFNSLILSGSLKVT